MRSDKSVILLGVASSDDDAVLSFLEELWSSGAVSDGLIGGAPLGGRSALIERDGIDFIVRAVGREPSPKREEVLTSADAIVLISTTDAAANAGYRDELSRKLQAVRPGNPPEKFVIGVGTSAFTCLDALRDKLERRRIEEARTVRMDVRTLESLARSAAVSDDWSEAATERVNLAEITMFTKPFPSEKPAPRPAPEPRKPSAATKKKPAAKKKAAKKKAAAAKKKPATKKKAAPKRKPIAKKKAAKKAAARGKVAKKRPTAKKRPAGRRR